MSDLKGPGRPIAEKLVALMKKKVRRALPDVPRQPRIDACGRHMKYGPTRRYWNDFVFEAYVNHHEYAIFLAGLPDVPGSRPHSGVNSRLFREGDSFDAFDPPLCIAEERKPR